MRDSGSLMIHLNEGKGHNERYSSCKVCGEEIRYIRYFDMWRTKLKIAGKGFGIWVSEEDADEIIKDEW